MSASSTLLSPSRGLHALLVGPALIHPSDRVDLLDLEFSSALWRRARLGRTRVSPVLSLEGPVQVTLHLRTDTQGRLRNTLAILTLEPVPTSLMTDSAPRWEVIGQVVRVDEATRQVTVRVLPAARRVKPFLLILSQPQYADWTLPKLTRWHFTGRIADERLLLEAVQAVAGMEFSLPGSGEVMLERSGAGGKG